MKIFIVVLFAVLQGCHGDSIEDLTAVINTALDSYNAVVPSIRTVIDLMVKDAQAIVDALVDGKTNECIVTLKAGLDAITTVVTTVADNCLTPEVIKQTAIVNGLIKEAEATANGLLNLVGTIVGNVLTCLSQLLDLSNSPGDLSDELLVIFTKIFDSLNILRKTTTICADNSVKQASEKITMLLKGVNKCL